MQEAVSDVLRMRAREVAGLNRMVVVSLAAHSLLIAALLFIPESWRSGRPRQTPVMMTISLGGSAGPKTGGMTQMAGRPVQAVAPPEPRRVDTPPAAKTPEMVVPDPAAKLKPRPPAKPLDKPIDKSTTRKPTSGPEIKSGAARADTGGQPIPFGGLSTSGGGGTGATLDVKDFCCPEYIQTMVDRIRSNWNANQGATGQVVVKFTIRSDGMLTNVEVERASGHPVLDMESRRAVLYTRQLPPLPAQFAEPHLTVHLNFGYQR
jgi:TonB family protein